MAIRVRANGSPVYHLQARGRCYWLTLCGRPWMSPSYTDEDGCCYERRDIMLEIAEAKAETLRLCKHCQSVIEEFYSLELTTRDEVSEGQP